MTPPTPAPDPRREGTSLATMAADAPRTGPLPALPGLDAEAAVRAAGAAARTPRRSAPRRPEPARPAADRAPPPAAVPEPSRHEGPTDHPAPHPAPATLGRVAPGAADEEALVEAGIAELWAAYADDPRKSTKDRLVL